MDEKDSESDEDPIDFEDLPPAEKIAALEFTEEERELLLSGVNENYHNYKRMREVGIDNSVPPAFDFDPRNRRPFYFLPEYDQNISPQSIERPENDRDLAFLTIAQLSKLIKNQEVTSEELVKLYLSRLKKYDPILDCVITLIEDEALERAKKLDHELQNDEYRGVLHGIPFGVKDIFSYPGYPTTWGAKPYKDQEIDKKATVIEKLEKEGAILIVKLSMGALAWGDVWFDGKTKSPWNTEKGSSGSSAGSASAVAAGLVPFALGTETYGSIISPATQCGVTGFRPTFGRVSRYGVMALSWSMDKVGPICRDIEDCGIIFNYIQGSDPKDSTTISKHFTWDYTTDTESVSIGIATKAFEEEDDEDFRKNNQKFLEKIRSQFDEINEITIPNYPIKEISFILNAEAATAFDELTLSDKDDLLVRQEEDAWPNVFRKARFIPAVEYIKANRIRKLIMREMEEKMKEIDVYVAPPFSDHLLLTNLTGHPSVSIPTGFRKNGLPTSITLIGDLYKESKLLAVAKKLQDNFEFHKMKPELEHLVE